MTEEPLLGLATTRELLNEVATRMEITQNSLKGSDLGRLCREAVSNLAPHILDYKTVAEETGCPCKFCEHNRTSRCECQPCSWIRDQWTEKAMTDAGHDSPVYEAPPEDRYALRHECEVMLSTPQRQRSVQHGDAFYEAVLALLDEPAQQSGTVTVGPVELTGAVVTPCVICGSYKPCEHDDDGSCFGEPLSSGAHDWIGWVSGGGMIAHSVRRECRSCGMVHEVPSFGDDP